MGGTLKGKHVDLRGRLQLVVLRLAGLGCRIRFHSQTGFELAGMRLLGKDLEDRVPAWDYMKNFWMDKDSSTLFPKIARTRVEGNEVRSAVSLNIAASPSPEWTGFEIEWPKERMICKPHFGKLLPLKFLYLYSYRWWRKLHSGMVRYGNDSRAS